MSFGLDAYAPLVIAVTLVLLFVAFAREWRPPEVSALALVALYLVIGILDITDVFTALSNPAPVTIAAMFIISASLVRTGALDAAASLLSQRAGDSPRTTMVAFFVLIAALSAFMNNTPLVMMMIPVAFALAARLKMPASRLLIPVSYAAILGGTCTLIGTSTNILVDGVAREAGLPGFHLLEIAPLGIVAAVAGSILMLVLQKYLPDRTTVAEQSLNSSQPRFMVEAVVDAGSPFIGRNPRQLTELAQGDRVLVDVVRGDLSLRRELDDVTLQVGDIVVWRTPVAEVLTMTESGELAGDPKRLQALRSRTSIIVEALLVPGARLLGHTLKELRLRRRYGVYPIALHHRGTNVRERFESTRLEIGDTLLLEGAHEDLKRFIEDFELVNVAEPSVRAYRRGKAPVAVAIVLAVVIAAAFELMPIAALAVIGAAAVLLLRCIEADEAFQTVDWNVLSLIIAMLAIGTALDKSGLVRVVVEAAAPVLSQTSPIVALALVYVLGSLLTEVVTNNAVAIILTPVAIGLAIGLGVDPRPFVVAVMFSASASFMTPIGYQTNTLVYGAGGYRFTDFLIIGVPLNIVVAVIAVMLIPVFWPL